MLKKLIKYIVIVVLVGAVALLLKNVWLPSVANFFKSKPVVIEDSPILIKQINELAQLCTVTVFDEVVVDSVEMKPKTATDSFLPGLSLLSKLPITNRGIVIIVKGKIVAGTDLKKLQQPSIFVHEDSVAVTLPHAEILDAIINPSGIETFSEMGAWTDKEITAVKIKARTKMIDRALQQNILSKADVRSKILMENFLRGIGFKKVMVAW